MIPLQALVFMYAGMLLESPERREQLIKFMNSAGAEVEKMVGNITSKGGASNNESVDSALNEEPTEFR